MKEKLKTSFALNLVIILLLCVLLYILFFTSLNCVTNHGKEVLMPDVRGRNADSALTELSKLKFDVRIDSTYEPTMRPMAVLRQVPDTGSLVKEGRTVFLTINMVTPPRIPMPNIKDLSYRSAEMILRNNKLLVGDTAYRSDIASGAILEASYNGNPIVAGTPVPQGSKINLIIGNGLGNTEWDVPDVTGMTVDEALITLNQFNLQPMLIVANQMEEITDTFSAIVTDQRPRPTNDAGAHNRIRMGEFLDLQIMQTPAPHDIHR